MQYFDTCILILQPKCKELIFVFLCLDWENNIRLALPENACKMGTSQQGLS